MKEFKFKDFPEAKYFLTTHASGGLTDNDFIMAKIVDELGG